MFLVVFCFYNFLFYIGVWPNFPGGASGKDPSSPLGTGSPAHSAAPAPLAGPLGALAWRRGARRDTEKKKKKTPPANAGDIRDMGSIHWSGRSPGGGHDTSTSVFLPGESHEQRSLVGYSPGLQRVRHD